ncbi:MAG: hypothetical protein QXQ40_00690 [Candidatus Aenigmatarchaeota archaeon]
MVSFDIIGDIAIIELRENNEKAIAKEIVKTNKRIKTVYKKLSAREGIYRIRKLKLVFGENKSKTTHKEHGCLFKLNIRRVYFSPREGTERLRIVEKINEYGNRSTAIVFFAGIGPYPILISKYCKLDKIIGIEVNPIAVKYFKENIKINKVKNVVPIAGDVRRVAKNYYNKCDFVVMPLPESGWKFLNYAIRCLKSKGICFFYAISDEKDLYGYWVKRIKSIAKKMNRKIKILDKKRVLPFGIRKWKVRIDFMVM